jgi:hypothetical protein
VELVVLVKMVAKVVMVVAAELIALVVLDHMVVRVFLKLTELMERMEQIVLNLRCRLLAL